MTDALRPMTDGLHALAEDGNSVGLGCHGAGVLRSDVFEQGERNGGVAAGCGAKGHVGVEHEAILIPPRHFAIGSNGNAAGAGCGDDQRERFTTVFRQPPITSACLALTGGPGIAIRR